MRPHRAFPGGSTAVRSTNPRSFSAIGRSGPLGEDYCCRDPSQQYPMTTLPLRARFRPERRDPGHGHTQGPASTAGDTVLDAPGGTHSAVVRTPVATPPDVDQRNPRNERGARSAGSVSRLTADAPLTTTRPRGSYIRSPVRSPSPMRTPFPEVESDTLTPRAGVRSYGHGTSQPLSTPGAWLPPTNE